MTALTFFFSTRLGHLCLTVLGIVGIIVAGYLAVQRWERSIRADERAAALTEFNHRQVQQSAKDRAAWDAERSRQEAELATIQTQLDQANALADQRTGEAERAIDQTTLEDRPLSPIMKKMLSELEQLR